jgi:hypothetical protein
MTIISKVYISSLSLRGSTSMESLFSISTPFRRRLLLDYTSQPATRRVNQVMLDESEERENRNHVMRLDCSFYYRTYSSCGLHLHNDHLHVCPLKRSSNYVQPRKFKATIPNTAPPNNPPTTVMNVIPDPPIAADCNREKRLPFGTRG